MKNKDPLYNRWVYFRGACNNPNHLSWKFYGAKHISYPKEWDNFEIFKSQVESVIGPIPPGNYHLDRPDNHASYGIDNIKWSTPKENYNNCNSNRIITYNNKTQTMKQWCEELDINPATFFSRMFDLGWTLKRVMGKSPYRKLK